MLATGDRRVAWLSRVAVVLAIAGVFGTWRKAGVVSLNGLEGPHNGWLVIIFGLIALAAAGPLSRLSWPGSSPFSAAPRRRCSCSADGVTRSRLHGRDRRTAHSLHLRRAAGGRRCVRGPPPHLGHGHRRGPRTVGAAAHVRAPRGRVVRSAA